MKYRIENGKALKLAGLSLRVKTKDGSNFTVISDYWDRVMTDGRWELLCAKARPVSEGGLGVIGVCRDFDMASGEFTYGIAIEEPSELKDMPKGTELYSVPASNWAKFTNYGPVRPNFQILIKRIFGEWLPASDWEHAGTAEIEFYTEGDMNSPDYCCEYWVPVMKAKT